MALNLNLRIFLHQVFNSARLMQDRRPASIIWVHVLASPALCPYGAAAVNVTLGHTAQGLSMATRPWRLKAALPGLTKGLHIASNGSIKKLGVPHRCVEQRTDTCVDTHSTSAHLTSPVSRLDWLFLQKISAVHPHILRLLSWVSRHLRPSTRVPLRAPQLVSLLPSFSHQSIHFVPSNIQLWSDHISVQRPFISPCWGVKKAPALWPATHSLALTSLLSFLASSTELETRATPGETLLLTCLRPQLCSAHGALPFTWLCPGRSYPPSNSVQMTLSTSFLAPLLAIFLCSLAPSLSELKKKKCGYSWHDSSSLLDSKPPEGSRPRLSSWALSLAWCDLSGSICQFYSWKNCSDHSLNLQSSWPRQLCHRHLCFDRHLHSSISIIFFIFFKLTSLSSLIFLSCCHKNT